MENIFKAIVILFLVFNSVGINAQTKPERLIGTWGFDYDKSMGKIDEQVQKDYASMPEAIKNNFEQTYKGRKLIFNPDGSFVQKTANGKQILGNWILDNNQNISVTSPQVGNITFKIEVLSEAMMVLQLQKKGNEQIVFSRWYLNKN